MLDFPRRFAPSIAQMSLFEDLEPWMFLARFRGQLCVLSNGVSESWKATTSCAAGMAALREDSPEDAAAAMRLKMVAVATILVAGVIGVAIPLVGRKHRFLRTDGGLYVCAKSLAAGVILATGFVHMLQDAEKALTDPCLPDVPWRQFPFSGFVAMVAALGTLLFDFLGTRFFERKHQEESAHKVAAAAKLPDEDEEGIVVISVGPSLSPEFDNAESGDEKSPMLISGMHSHAAPHHHSHHDQHGTHDGHGHSHSHCHGHEPVGKVSSQVRHAVVSQILELGIVSHSVIIGLSLGVSRNPSTIRPLVAALSFHQFFEGFALAGCVSQAQFKALAATLMALFFAITTPTGIAVGAGVASFYNANSPRALVIEGLLDSVSAGILIYMALVDLIAADFLGQRMSCSVRLQVASYVCLLLGAVLMSSLAVWA